MKHHIMIALGLLMLILFAVQAFLALGEPGLGVKEAYVAGGFILAGMLLRGGLAEWRRAAGRGQGAGHV
ncbi:MAG: hypothetical protein AAGH87_07310 [Pseudomonadota bacterium]